MNPDIIQLLPDLGSLGIMALFLYLFWTGGIVSKKTYENAIEMEKRIAEKTAEIIANRLCEKLDELPKALEEATARGAERGVGKGILKLNGGDNSE